ncbi:DNA-binding protein [Thermoplasmatales archaeon SW_10_69_26]|nr:MAG: DNA-binding protein [Thermoplasmatales archaeon SW_10_69_26]
MGETLVVDTGPLMEGFTAPDDDRCLVPPKVMSELEDHDVSNYEILERGLVTTFPTDYATKLVRDYAEETGDLDVLSDTDIEVVALAGEEEAVLVSDDYAVQNVAKGMDIEVRGHAQEGISEEREWIWYCPGCGEHEGDRKGECPVCGTELKRRPV